MTFIRTPGIVTCMNVSGSDQVVANAACVTKDWEEFIELPEKKAFRIMEEMPQAGHWGTLDHCHLTFHIKTPIFVARQILRASNMSFNEKSMRYLEAVPEFYIPELFYTDVKRKELGQEPVPLSEEIQSLLVKEEESLMYSIWSHYQWKLSKGVRKEQARMSLPVNTFTEFWMTGALSDWFHFLNLRLDEHAQLETRFIAEQIEQVVAANFPAMHENWVTYARGPLPSGCIQTP